MTINVYRESSPQLLQVSLVYRKEACPWVCLEVRSLRTPPSGTFVRNCCIKHLGSRDRGLSKKKRISRSSTIRSFVDHVIVIAIFRFFPSVHCSRSMKIITQSLWGAVGIVSSQYVLWYISHPSPLVEVRVWKWLAQVQLCIMLPMGLLRRLQIPFVFISLSSLGHNLREEG